jgi:outer membrane murein-binding lipoprotein Lpp
LNHLVKVFLVFSLAILFAGCESSEGEHKTVANTAVKQEKSDSKTQESTVKQLKTDVDVIRFANMSASVFDKEFGEPVKVTEIKDNPRLMPGEFREYQVTGHPKNLSVRFYKDKAKRFNLLLGKAEKSSKDALMDIFKIDVGEMRQVKSGSLSETWAGRANGINFKTAYAKRSKAGEDFVMLHSEIE